MLYDSAFATLTLLTTSIVNLTDTYFISKLGSSATAAVGVAFAVQFFIQAIGFMLGMGGGSLFSRARGANQTNDCCLYASFSFFLSLIIGILLSGMGLLFLDRLLSVLGATKSNYPYAKEYLRLLLFSAPFICMSLTLSQLMRSAGNAAFSMIGFSSGNLCNLLLVPLFLFVWKSGIAGAGYAILIGYAISSLLLILFSFSKHSHIKISLKIKKDAFKKIGGIFLIGLPSFFRHGFSGIATLLLNNTARAYGDSAIAAITVVSKVSILALSVCTGIGQGMLPSVGYFYGANQKENLRHAYRFALVLSGALMLALSLPIFGFAPQIISLFRKEAEIVRIGTKALRLMSSILAFHGTITVTTMLLQAIGKTFPATILACARQGVFFIPLIFLIPQHFRLIQPLSDVLTFLLTLCLFKKYRRLIFGETEAASKKAPMRESS